MTNEIQNPNLSWQAEQPRHRQYDDSYFSDSGGPAESDYVFLQHNDLPQRFSALADESFTVGELGFGTGLNFLLTWQLWRTRAAPSACLDYISVEAEPFSAEQFLRAHQQWPKLEPLAAELRRACRHLHAGFNLRTFDRGRVRLLLLVGDVAAVLPEVQAHVDAWFLDGFAPAKNPEMWSSQVMLNLAQLSKAGTTLATYSAAGSVRRALLQTGFEVEKAQGFGRKRHMLRGCLGNAARQFVNDRPVRHWARPIRFPLPEKVTIVGAGLAGAATAQALASRGLNVEVVEAAPYCAAGASSMPAMIVRPYPERQRSPAHRFYEASSAYAEYRLHQLETWNTPVSLQNESVGQERGQDSNQSRRLETAGVIHPRDLCQAWLDHPKIHCRYNHPIETLESLQPSAQHAVILANGDGLRPFDCEAIWPLTPVRGQMLRLSGAGRILPNEAICFDGYCIPYHGDLLLGASFDRGSSSLEHSEAEAQVLLNKFSTVLPELAAEWASAERESICGIRLSTEDHLPLIGPMIELSHWQEIAEALKHGRKIAPATADQYVPGLWINAAHGSRGATAALLGAEMLASQICGTALPIELGLLAHMHPARFYLRKIRRA